ncbi:restriction endonuclease subunit S [Helicobacter sp. T3_23-1059]
MAQGGKWEEFKLINLFNYVRGTRLVKSARIKGDLPLLTAGEFNQGVKEFISNQNQQIFNNAITIDMFCNSFVHIENFCCDDNILVLNAKKPMNKYHLRFISTIINKDKSKYGYGKQYRMGSLENHKVLLPTIDGKIAFDFMESYIKELEAERIQELEAYLEVTGLNDYELNAQEREALAIFASSLRASEASVAIHTTFCHTERSEVSHKNSDRDISAFSQPQYDNVNSPSRSTSGARGWVNPRNDALNLQWREFTIGDLFEIKPTKAYKMTNTTLFATKGNVPVVTNSSLNNGVSGYVDLEPTEKGNMITYSDTTTSEGIFYQPRDFIGYSHIQGLYPLQDSDKWNKYALLYFVVLFRKASFGLFDYANKFNRQIAKQMTIKLPVNQNNQIAFDFMEIFISAVQKEVIKSVVLWKQKRINATKAYK